MPTSTADAPSPWTIQKLIGWAAGYLKKHGVDSPRLSAEVLLATALGASLDEAAPYGYALLTGAALSECYEEELRVERIDNRYRAWLAG